MATQPVKYNTLILKYGVPWKGAVHTTSLKTTFSGQPIADEADAAATALDLAGVFTTFQKPGIQWLDWIYYAPGATVATFAASFTKQPNNQGDAYQSGPINQPAAGEMAVMLYAPVGRSSKGKTTYLRKFVHGVPVGAGEGDVTPAVAMQNTGLSLLSQGFGTANFVTVSPTTGAQSGAWAVANYYHSRQFRRGQKRKGS